MRVSYDWLNRYFEKPLVYSDVVSAIQNHSFEVEDEEDVNGVKTFEVKVLPDRASSCLSHMGIAKEVGAVLNLPTKEQEISEEEGEKEISVKIEEPELCRRYVGQLIENISVKESPEWIKKSLESIGQRSINNIVDITNYVLFDLGQPMHAFDADKVVGGITVRKSKKGEKITSLDGKNIELDSELVIADDEGPLALAGVKGGVMAEVTKDTKRIIFESASFDPVHTRQSAQKAGIRTDASKRFENNVSPELVILGIKRAIYLLKADLPDAVLGRIVDVYTKKKEDKEFSFELSDFKKILGVEIGVNDVEKILSSLQIPFRKEGEKYFAKNPPTRSDLNIKEDIVEEVGRMYGYHNIVGVLPERTEKAGDDKNFLIANALRKFFLDRGFSEIYGYAFESEGKLELENPLAEGKEFLRVNLSKKVEELVSFNLQHILLDNEPVRIFEVGKVFPTEEKLHIVFAIGYRKKKFNKNPEEASEIISGLEKLLPGIQTVSENKKDEYAVLEFDLSGVSASGLTETDLGEFLNKGVKYKSVSPYPRIIRDVALFVKKETSTDEVAKMIAENAGELLYEGPVLFDEFEKDGERSLAFRYSLQSGERTLLDSEANDVHERVEKALKKAGFTVRK